jgi:hypothetical protein
MKTAQALLSLAWRNKRAVAELVSVLSITKLGPVQHAGHPSFSLSVRAHPTPTPGKDAVVPEQSFSSLGNHDLSRLAWAGCGLVLDTNIEMD